MNVILICYLYIQNDAMQDSIRSLMTKTDTGSSLLSKEEQHFNFFENKYIKKGCLSWVDKQNRVYTRDGSRCCKV